MKTEELESQGLTKEQIDFVMAENGKDLKKLQKENERLKGDLETAEERAATAEETLSKFDGIDPEEMKKEVEKWKKDAEDAKKDYESKLEQRDFEDALKAELEEIEFTSEAAKKSIMADIREAGLKVKNGKILGLSDLLGQLRESDASAFVDKETKNLEEGRARFTKPLNNGTEPSAKVSPSELMKMKNENPDLDIRKYM